MIQVLLADDEGMIRTGVRTILCSAPDIDVIAEAADGHTAVELAQRHRPHVALLDVQMPKLDGLGAGAQIRATLPETAVVILTTFNEDEYIARAIRHGASGFLLKSGDPSELINGVRAAADGAACLSPPIARRVLSELGGQRMSRAATARQQVATLTPRERDVLALVAKGLSNAAIAGKLYLVEGTVKAHMTTIMNRLDAHNRVQAAILAYEAGLLDDGEP